MRKSIFGQRHLAYSDLLSSIHVTLEPQCIHYCLLITRYLINSSLIFIEKSLHEKNRQTMTFISKLAHSPQRQVSNLLSHIILLFFVLTEKSIILGFKNRDLEPRLKGGIEVLCSTTLQSFSSSYSPATTSHEFIIGWTSSSGHWRIQCLKTKKILLNLTLFILCSSFSS